MDAQQDKVLQQKLSLFKKITTKLIRVQNINFWILASFLPTFVIARFLVYHFPKLFLMIGDVHVHHLTYGIFLLSIAGILSLNFETWRWRIFNASIYGIGLALAFDEFGMWIRLEDDYWIRQSYDAIIILTSILVNIIYFSFVWNRLVHVVKSKGEHPFDHQINVASGHIGDTVVDQHFSAGTAQSNSKLN